MIKRLVRAKQMGASLLKGAPPYFAIPLNLDGDAGPVIILACYPKSGSTFLQRKLTAATGLPHIHLYSNAQCQEIDPLRLIQNNGRSCVCQMHLRASPYTTSLINKHGAHVVVLERDIADAIVSMHAFTFTEEFKRNVDQTGVAFLPNVTITDGYYSMTTGQQLDHIISTAAPWYAAFSRGWRTFAKQLDNAVTFLTFEKLIADPTAAIETICKSVGIGLDGDRLDAAMAANHDTRLNIGKAGRSENVLSPQHNNRINELVAPIYDHVQQFVS